MDEILREFLIEAREMLGNYREALDAVAAGGQNIGEKLELAYRGIHTIHGGSGFLALGSLEELSSRGEVLLWNLREAGRPPGAGDTLLLGRIGDACAELLDRIEATGREGPPPALLKELSGRNGSKSGGTQHE